jgi:hypothetical protein
MAWMSVSLGLSFAKNRRGALAGHRAVSGTDTVMVVIGGGLSDEPVRSAACLVPFRPGRH